MSAEKFEQKGANMGIHLDVERFGATIIIHGPMDSEFNFRSDGKGDVVLTSQPMRNPLSDSDMKQVFQKAREALLASNPKAAE